VGEHSPSAPAPTHGRSASGRRNGCTVPGCRRTGSAGGVLRSIDRSIAQRNNDIHLETHELASEVAEPVDSVRPSPLDPDVLSLHVGPAGAFAQEYTVMRNTLSDNKLYGHGKASQYCISDLTVL
jgi:hypothetical protein